MKNLILMSSIAILTWFGLTTDAFAPCCFPYDSDGYIDPLTGFYVGVSEVQNDSYLWLPFGKVTYVFQFFDENDNVILEKTETITDDLPIKSGFTISPGLTFPFKIIVNDTELSKKIKSFQFTGTENLEYFSWKPADLIVSFDNIDVTKTTGNYNTLEIQGSILNNHTQGTKNVHVLASIYQKENHIIGVAGYSSDDKQPLVLNGFESKNFTLYTTIPSNLIPDHVGFYAESDESSMIHQYYKPIILKDDTNLETKSSTDPKKPIPISANITNISRKDLDFNWIIQIKKSPKSISEGDLSQDPKSKIEFIEAIQAHVNAQQSIRLEYSWIPQSNGIYFYEMYAWDNSKAKAFSYPFTGTFLSDNWLVVSSNLNPPLKQFKSGINVNDIECRESLILVHKINGSPACVKPEHHAKLIIRGWALMRIYIPGDIPSGVEIPKDVDVKEFEYALSQSKFYGLRPETILSVTDQAFKSWMTLEMIPEIEYKVREDRRTPWPPNPILEFKQEELHQKVKAMIEEMWKYGGYKPSEFDQNMLAKEINLNSTERDHQSIYDWLKANHQKQFGGDADTGFTNYFKYKEHIYSLAWGIAD